MLVTACYNKYQPYHLVNDKIINKGIRERLVDFALATKGTLKNTGFNILTAKNLIFKRNLSSQDAHTNHNLIPLFFKQNLGRRFISLRSIRNDVNNCNSTT
jgi:hypothetical protein